MLKEFYSSPPSGRGYRGRATEGRELSEQYASDFFRPMAKNIRAVAESAPWQTGATSVGPPSSENRQAWPVNFM